MLIGLCGVVISVTGQYKTSQLMFYETACYLHKFRGKNIKLDNLTEQSVSKCWERLSTSKYKTLISDCLRLRDELNLCDWAYVKLVERVSAHFFSDPSTQAIMSTFLLVKSGYDARLCRMGERVGMLVHTSDPLYRLGYYVINGKEYYSTSPVPQGINVKSYLFDFSLNSVPVQMVVDKYPKFTANEDEIKTYSFDAWKEVPAFTLSINPSVMRFYEEYPSCDLKLYGEAALSPEFEEKVLSVFRKLIADKSQREAAGLLLSYVQYGFSYQTDAEQFGYDRPFFVDENFFYPFNTCKDRSILFAKLIKELLGLKVVYLEYPNHLATAVLFTEPIEGDYIMIDEQPYTVCDPSFIGAPIGKAMPDHKPAKAQIIRL